MSRRYAIYCKSFRDDFGRLAQLVESKTRFCPDIPMVLSVPKEDVALLYDTIEIPNGVWVVSDESYVGDNNLSKYGWLFQQICKMSLSHLDFADSYYIIDSDSYFINPIESDHFEDRFGRLKVLASPISTRYWGENPLLEAYLKGEVTNNHFNATVEPLSHAEFLEELSVARLAHKADSSKVAGERRAYISGIFNPTNDRRISSLNWGPSPIFHKEILLELESLIAENGMNWRDLIYLAPWEYEWYGFFAMRTFQGLVLPSVSSCLHFATEEDVKLAKSKGITISDISRKFTSIAMASRHFDLAEF